jgi:hypothetical protein
MNILEQIRAELIRVDAKEIKTTLDSQFEPETGELVRIEHDKAYWHLLPQDFAAVLQALPDGAGTNRVRAAIESDTIRVWHGPSPKDSRDEP